MHPTHTRVCPSCASHVGDGRGRCENETPGVAQAQAGRWFPGVFEVVRVWRRGTERTAEGISKGLNCAAGKGCAGNIWL